MKPRFRLPKNRIYEHLKSVWAFLVIPPRKVSDPLEQEKARLLQSLLIIVLPIGLLTLIFYPLITGNQKLNPRINMGFIFFSIVIWIIIYTLARSKYYNVGAWLAIFLGIITILAFALPDARYGDFFHLAFVIIFSSFFFNIKEVLIVYILCLISIGAGIIFFPDINFGEYVFFPAAVITLSGLLSLIGAQYLKNVGALYFKQELLRDEQYRILLEHTYDGMAEIKGDLIVAADGNFANIYGKKLEEIIGIPFTDILPQNRVTNLKKYTFETITKNEKGDELHLEVLISPVQTFGTGNQLIAVRNITERKSEENELKQQALFDPVTGLYNRTQLLKHVQHQRRFVSQEIQTSLFFLDLDDFKTVNDQYGHDTGDKLLNIVGGRLQNAIREGDIASRYGGDEFVVVCHHPTDDTLVIAQRVLSSFHVPFQINTISLQMTCSLGIVRNIQAYTDVDAIIRAADEAMYRAKTKGKNQFEFALPEKRT